MRHALIMEMIKVQNMKWCLKQTSVKGEEAHISVAYLDKHSTLDPVMVSVVGSIPTGGNFLLKLFENLNVNSGLKCKCDLTAYWGVSRCDANRQNGIGMLRFKVIIYCSISATRSSATSKYLFKI